MALEMLGPKVPADDGFSKTKRMNGLGRVRKVERHCLS